METFVAEIHDLFKTCSCGNHHNEIPIERIVAENGALNKVASFLAEKSFTCPKIVADISTMNAAGARLTELLTAAGLEVTSCEVTPDENGDVVADEKALVQVLLETGKKNDVMVAVGSGTIHDITRFCSATLNIPFISIPTAPSVDGFTSLGAPLIVRGVKKTFQMTSPIAVFADINVLKKAPKEMIAAGVGDMIAKYTSLADWKFERYIADAPYCELSAELTQLALDECVTSIEKIAKAEDEGITILIESLIKSGIAMLVFGQSHPASGGEHHLSHYWEMDLLKNNRPQVLHGAKVGVTTILLSSIYKREFLNELDNILRNDTIQEKHDKVLENLRVNKDKIDVIIQAIPDPESTIRLMQNLGGPVLPNELGISESLVNDSLKQAHHLRDRYTVLKFLNEVLKTEYDSVAKA